MFIKQRKYKHNGTATLQKIDLIKSLCLCVFAFNISFTALAQSNSQVNVKIAFDSTAILIGDQINFSIQVEQPKSAKVTFPVFADTISKNIEILSALPTDTVMVNANTIRILKKYLVTSFDSGDYKIDFLKFPVLGGDTAYSNATMLYVRAIPVKDPDKIADIKGVIDIPLTFKEVLPYIGGGFGGLLLLAFLAYAYYRWKNKKPIFGMEKPVEPPHVIAFRDLEKLRGEKLWQQGLFKQYYSRLTDILRAYIENRFHIPAMESTSDEILRDIQDNPLVDAKLRADLKEMLSVADLVKFAKAEPLPDENENAWQFANDFVVKTFRDPVQEEMEQVENEDVK